MAGWRGPGRSHEAAAWFCLMVVWDGCSGSRLALAWKARVPGGPLDRALRRRPGRAERLGIRANRQDRRNRRPGVAVGIKVRDGQATVRVPSLGAASEAMVIVSSLSRAAGPFPITIEAHNVAEPALPDRVEEEAPRPRPLAAFPPEAVREASRSLPPANRDFHMMVRDGDVTSSGNYLAVPGVLRAVGKYVQVYVAAEDQHEVGSELLNDLVRTFDEQILPVAARSFGRPHDIDRDGRFTVLLSSWLSRLGNGRHAVDGFVRVTDLDPLYSAPFGNRCDMMYLSTELRPGPHLRTIMAHEYMHAVVFSRKSHPGSGPALCRSRRKAGSMKRSRTWPRTCTVSVARTSITA